MSRPRRPSTIRSRETRASGLERRLRQVLERADPPASGRLLSTPASPSPGEPSPVAAPLRGAEPALGEPTGAAGGRSSPRALPQAAARGAQRAARHAGREGRRMGALALRAFERYQSDGADLLAASLAFHTLLSIAPLILIAVAVAGLVLGHGTARQEASQLLTQAMGGDAARVVDEWVAQAAKSGELASAVGITLVLLTATRLGSVLQLALNRIIVAAPAESALRDQVVDYLRRRLVAAALVLGAGPLLLAVFASRTLLTGFHELWFADSAWAGVAVQASQLALSVVLVTAVCALIYRWVPRRRLDVRSALVGGVSASLMFNVANAAVGLYLGRFGVSAAYGLAGSAVAVLIWLHLSASVFLYGAELAEVYRESREPQPPAGPPEPLSEPGGARAPAQKAPPQK